MPTAHRWRFFRAGGFDQVRIDSGADIAALPELDLKLWVALSCPTKGVEFDAHTLDLLDIDKDGHIRAAEVLDAVRFTCGVLKDPKILVDGNLDLALDQIDENSLNGARLVASAKRILVNLGKGDSKTISPSDTVDTDRVFAGTRFNGDGVIVPDSAEGDDEARALIQLVIDTMGGRLDAGGGIGIDADKVDAFVGAIGARAHWLMMAPGQPVLVDVAGTFGAYDAVRDKVEDFWKRVQLADMDPQAAAALNPGEADLRALVDPAAFPLAHIAPGVGLPLEGRLNPAWHDRIVAFRDHVVRPIVGANDVLTLDEWRRIKLALAAHDAWAATRPATENDLAIGKLEDKQIRELHRPEVRAKLHALIDKDNALAEELAGLGEVDRLVHFRAHLHAFLNQFVAFRKFYERSGPGIFQAGTLYLDGRSAELTLKVDDVAKHAVLALHSMTYLAYCDCVRRGEPPKAGEERPVEKTTIAAAFTAGDSDYLMVGRNGVYVDRKGNDWDATITRVVEQPISVRQAFFSPYKRVAKTVSESIEKFAGAKNAAGQNALGSAIAATAAHPATPAPPAAPPAPFDVAKFAGIFAAIGLALGAVGSAITAVVTGFMGLQLWQMPLAITAALLVVSGPSMILAAMKLRQRNLGPLLDAGGWAINARAKVNIHFGRTLTGLGVLPPGSERDLRDPYGRAPRWPYYLLVFVLIVAGVWAWRTGRVDRWRAALAAEVPAAASAVAPAPAPAAAK